MLSYLRLEAVEVCVETATVCDLGFSPNSADACGEIGVVGHGVAFGLPAPRSEEVAVQQERLQQLQLGLPRVRQVRGQ